MRHKSASSDDRNGTAENRTKAIPRIITAEENTDTKTFDTSEYKAASPNTKADTGKTVSCADSVSEIASAAGFGQNLRSDAILLCHISIPRTDSAENTNPIFIMTNGLYILIANTETASAVYPSRSR